MILLILHISVSLLRYSRRIVARFNFNYSTNIFRILNVISVSSSFSSEIFSFIVGTYTEDHILPSSSLGPSLHQGKPVYFSTFHDVELGIDDAHFHIR